MSEVVIDSPFYTSKSFVSLIVLLFLIVYRKYGSFYYKSTMAIITVSIMAIYGFIISVVFRMLGLTHLVNWSVARGYYYLGGFFCDLTVVPEGLEHIEQYKDQSAIFVCNHQSSIDIMLMGKVYPKNTAIVAKKALKYYPFLGWFMTLTNSIFLDRKNRQNAVKEAKQAAIDIHSKKTNVWLFPEGTRGHEAEATLLPFKKGAFYMAVQAKVPIIPIVIGNYNSLYDTKSRRFRSGTVRCRVLPAISTESIEEDSASIDKLTNACRDQMLAALKEISPNTKKTQ